MSDVAAPVAAVEPPGVAPGTAPPAQAVAQPAGPGSAAAVAPPAAVPVQDGDAPAARAIATPMPAPAAGGDAEAVAVPAPAATGAAGKPTFPMHAATTQVPARPAVGHASAADAGSIGGAVFSLLLVVGLILGLGWLAKRLPGLQRGAGSGQLKVVASVALGPRDRAVVVDVGGTQLLLGVGSGGVRTLHRLEQPLPAAEPTGPSPFAQILAQHFGKKA